MPQICEAVLIHGFGIVASKLRGLTTDTLDKIRAVYSLGERAISRPPSECVAVDDFCRNVNVDLLDEVDSLLQLSVQHIRRHFCVR